ncbi:hypothetical protein Esi_0423_0015 [Ectocarpus siliculosus]|uniref:WSC domain-containing protein n=1 Tax=Ectocarpus siliculosus TaxID=2880 RepID=D7G108_ECTSI|nr:hypothetical protein Esi_0423_0015 [Ectocarpus siliculosus]|eukprot:CBJ33118.1 hypothetical protein Esi_0423_0015 [Ectocarpus siliculosus]
MTTAVCEGLCANYAYYGTQYGTEAVCLEHCSAYPYYGTQYSTEDTSSDEMTAEYSREERLRSRLENT